ncbi:putative component of the lipoprotein assembly complex (forms a complex with YaeT, YfgL, and NlpB) [Candidatus Palibaumannia cicadellinicola]|uniref:Outer membrane protein assembly factor BamD n=1 Tax=Candidatus Palibaumannia cicadellinicola TaxID=186490 RepID=A0A0K2BKC6_9GAMM|nr:putative component of the lipoprotein assembly complex (forms a complex with YaeT, YfgL, and NlpB) [Candidatus Baumannia cicadellinicola]
MLRTLKQLIISINNLLFITISLILVACSHNRSNVYDKLQEEIYQSARHKLQGGHYKDAIKQLETLDHYYTLGNYTQQVQLDLIYAYYKIYKLKNSKKIIDSFLLNYPTHPNIDYVLYMLGLIEMAIDDRLLLKLLCVNDYERDPGHARAAFDNFKKIIYNFPNSKYAIYAIKRLIYLKHRLAKHELYLVKYYSNIGAYIAVVNRVDNMLSNFPDTNYTYKALPYMENAYKNCN